MSNEIRINHSNLIAAIRSALEHAGVPAHIAQIEAEIMAEADLMGVPSHGVRMLPGLVRAIHEGRASANPSITLTRERGATCVLDGDNGPGRFVSLQAMNRAVEKSKLFGIGACMATRVTHWGRAFAYAYRAAQAGAIGICMTNAVPNMLGWNSTRPLLGNNPLAIGVPRGQREPVVLDLAMSQAALGKVGTFSREGKDAPTGWGLDKDGNPTNDPQEILASGRLLPFGDHKGTGLAVMMELLTGALSGMMLSQEVVAIDHSGLDPNTSKLFIALDPDAFSTREQLANKFEQLAAWLRDAEPGLDITFPGDRSWQTREINLRDGIPIHRDIIAQLLAVGVELS
ncbi:MAG: Ldh family oxidoreductase [Chloroflexi bacterium]|nr:Ldh family oxidoreductase [Chloroflexota bacterium]